MQAESQFLPDLDALRRAEDRSSITPKCCVAGLSRKPQASYLQGGDRHVRKRKRNEKAIICRSHCLGSYHAALRQMFIAPR
jgi:heterodisulfide reductase subunit B